MSGVKREIVNDYYQCVLKILAQRVAGVLLPNDSRRKKFRDYLSKV